MNSSTAEQNNQDSPARTIPSDNKIVRLAYGFRGQLLVSFPKWPFWYGNSKSHLVYGVFKLFGNKKDEENTL